MSTPFIGEIRIFAGNYAPAGWAFCDGSLLPVSGNNSLFTLIGTTYGGDGTDTFALPDLRGRTPVHAGTPGSGSYVLGEVGGAETVTLTEPQLPAHAHVPSAAPSATTKSPAGATWATQASAAFAPGPASVAMAADAIQPAGGSQPHDNMPPFLALTYIIALEGIFPTAA